MNFKTLSLVCAVFAASSAFADTYQVDTNLEAHRISDGGFKSHEEFNQARINYYFKGVNTDGVPQSEAAFLGQNSNIYGAVSQWSDSINTYRVGAEFYIPESFLYVRGEAERIEDFGNFYLASIGLTPIKGLRIWTDYEYTTMLDSNPYRFNVNAKYVVGLGGNFLNVTASYKDGKYGDTTKVGGDFYFDPSFSVGAEYVNNQNWEDETTIRTRKFFNESLSGSLSYTDVSDSGDNRVMLGVGVRF